MKIVFLSLQYPWLKKKSNLNISNLPFCHYTQILGLFEEMLPRQMQIIYIYVWITLMDLQLMLL